MNTIITAAEVFGPDDPDHPVVIIARIGGGLYRAQRADGKLDDRLLRDMDYPDAELLGPDEDKPHTTYKVFATYEQVLAIAEVIAGG